MDFFWWGGRGAEGWVGEPLASGLTTLYKSVPPGLFSAQLNVRVSLGALVCPGQSFSFSYGGVVCVPELVIRLNVGDSSGQTRSTFDPGEYMRTENL